MGVAGVMVGGTVDRRAVRRLGRAAVAAVPTVVVVVTTGVPAVPATLVRVRRVRGGGVAGAAAGIAAGEGVGRGGRTGAVLALAVPPVLTVPLPAPGIGSVPGAVVPAGLGVAVDFPVAFATAVFLVLAISLSFVSELLSKAL